LTNLNLEKTAEYGNDTGRGNLLGIEPYMLADDYTSEATFYSKLDGYMQVAQQKGWLNQRTIVIWPEYIGTWLVAAGAGDRVLRAQTLNAAMTPIVLRHLPQFIGAYLSTKEKDRLSAALFRARGANMARLYNTVFSSLAQRYGVTMVAGSTVLPSPQIKDGKVVAGIGPLFNTSAVFTPDGRALAPLICKAFPITEEIPFISPAPVDLLPAFDTPAGRLGVLICADSWYPQVYDRLKAQGIEWLAVASLLDKTHWDEPWHGYNGAPAPQDVDPGDVGALTEGEAWHKYAMPGRISQAGASCGMTVFLHGRLWDLGVLDGQAMLVNQAGVSDARVDGAAILNLWLA
jgi:hypothetical protein